MTHQRYFVRIEQADGEMTIEQADSYAEAIGIKTKLEEERPDLSIEVHPAVNNLPIFDGYMAELFRG